MATKKIIKEEAVEKRFSSYKARLLFNDDKGFSINVPIRWKKLDTKEMDNAYPIVFRTPEGKEAKFKFFTNDGKIIATEEDKLWFDPDVIENKAVTQKKYWVTEDGTVCTDKLQAYQVVDGKEQPVEKFKKSEDFIVMACKDVGEYDEWLQENLYAIWGEKEQDVYSISQFAKYLYENELMAVVKISIGNSFKEFYGLIKPKVTKLNDGASFGILMKTARKRIKLDEFGQMQFVSKQPKVPAKDSSKAKTKMDTI